MYIYIASVIYDRGNERLILVDEIGQCGEEY